MTNGKTFWSDILGTLGDQGEPSHYMGYLVLQSSDDKNFDVIDGQQRLTTITLIVLAALKSLQRLIEASNERDANASRFAQIRQTYIGYLDPVTLLSRSKLTLNRNNDSYFQNYLVPLRTLPQRGLRSSEHSLRKAFEWFDQQVTSYLRTSSEGQGRRLAKLVEDISDRLFFTVITVTDELNAYKVFETLNARGVRLSATDLLKNYLFSVLDRDGEDDYELRNLEERWETIVGRLQSENFPDFLRVHWNSRNSFARQSDLFKIIRSRVNSRESVFELLRGIEEDLDTYLALSSPEISEWSPEEKHFAGVLRTFRVRQPFPILLAARRILDAGDFAGLLRATAVISLRYNVIGAYSTADQERTYNSVAERLAKGELRRLTDVLQALRPVYVEDNAFKLAFAEKIVRTTDARNSRVVRFILCALEKHLSSQDLDFASDAFSIEHVLPQNAPDGWGGFTNDEAGNLAYRLGNMTLLETSLNRDLGTSPYPAKRDVYRNSGFATTRRLADENAVWMPAQIAARQNWMANQAAAIWRLAQFSSAGDV